MHQDKTQAKIFNPKVGFSLKCVGKRKNEEGIRVMDLKCAHAKNETAYVLMNHPFILQQAEGGNDQNNKKKVIQLIFMLFNKKEPMIDHEDSKPLYDFLKLKSNLKKH